MVNMRTLWTLLLVFSIPHAHANERVINKIVWLTTSNQIASDLAKSQRDAAGKPFHFYAIDEGLSILKHFESEFPSDLNHEPESVKNAYLHKHIAPKLKAYAPELMRSEMGASLAKLYRVERIPAVVINDQYVTYGLSVGQSIQAFYGNSYK